MVGHHIMVLWWGHAPQFLCYQWDFLLDIFTEEGSYQGLKDTTSFGLLSDKSAEILGSEYSNFCQFSILANSAIFGLRGRGLNFSQKWRHTHVQRQFSVYYCPYGGQHIGKLALKLWLSNTLWSRSRQFCARPSYRCRALWVYFLKLLSNYSIKCLDILYMNRS